MKRHLIGFLIFNLIIATSFVICQCLIDNQLERIDFVSSGYFLKNKPFEKSNVKVIQAIFNQHTKQLDIGFLYNREGSTQEANIALHFYNRDGKNIRYITSERITTRFSINIEQNRVLHESFTCEWLAKPNSNENYYVWIEELPKNTVITKTPISNFDFSSTVPILIDYSMDDYIEQHSSKGF